jgi:hypothetical protein
VLILDDILFIYLFSMGSASSKRAASSLETVRETERKARERDQKNFPDNLRHFHSSIDYASKRGERCICVSPERCPENIQRALRKEGYRVYMSASLLRSDMIKIKW